ncbi:MAG: FISUMP domain-containing protein [Patescibacteria group bacterium]|nr:MAG: FISUMP domain-containing protein [Patescibacteria group bacterium]
MFLLKNKVNKTSYALIGYTNKPKAFTLIELLVVIAIIGILSTLVVVALGNSRTSARDAKRLNDLKAMANALELYYANNNSYPEADNFSPGATFEAGGVVYMGKVPNNPTPHTDGGCPDNDYTYTQVNSGQSYIISTCLGTQAPNSPATTSTTVTYSPSGMFQCGQTIINDLDGNAYNTVQIGSQCWMKENLNTKIRPNGTCINGGGSPPCPTASVSDNGLGRSCYSNSEVICATDGSLYTWAAAMNGSTTPGVQGICPTGWHIPTDDEFKIMEMYLGVSQAQADTSSWRGTDEGRRLKSERTVNGSPPPGIPTSDHPRWDYYANFGTDTSGFSALPAGLRDTNGSSFSSRSMYANLWSSSPSGGSAWRRGLGSYEARVYRDNVPQTHGYGVRCLKN